MNQGSAAAAPAPRHAPPLHDQAISYNQKSETATNTDWQLISELTDPDEIGIAGNMDILHAWIEQSGLQLRLSIETRLPIRTEYPSDTYAGVFLWLIDADQDPGTGQPHLGIGSEFNVRAVIRDPGGGGFVDPTGTLPGGGSGTVTVIDKIIRITIGLNQVASPEQFSWSASSFEMLDDVYTPGNHETTVAVAAILPTPPLDLGLDDPSYDPCGHVRIEGRVWSTVGDVSRIDWDWGDGFQTTGFFPAEHEYSANGTYTVTAEAFADTGESHAESLTVEISNADVAGCEVDITLHPWQIYLRDGVTEKPLLIEGRDDEGRPVNPAQLQLVYEVTSDEIGDLRVSADGVVSATGYGRGGVRVTLLPGGQTAELEVFAGHLRPAPMFQHLSLEGNRVGSVSPDIANADGTPVDLAGHQVSYSCNGCDPGHPLQIDQAGNLFLAEDWEHGDPAPLSVNVVVDGVRSEYDAVIHAGVEDLGLTIKDYVTHNTIISSATGSAGHDFDAIISSYMMPQLFDLGYEWQKYLMSGIWHGGARQGLINYTSLNRFDGVFPGCGGSGNPIRTGTNFEDPPLSCFFNDLGGGNLTPRWGIVFHELGHNVTWTAGLFGRFASAGDGFNYSEGLATAAAMFTCEAILRAGKSVGITDAIAESLRSSWLCWRLGVSTALADYIAGGAIYSTMTPDVVDDILDVLINEFDYGLIYRLFGMFTPRNQGGYPFELLTTEQQATMFAVGCSVAAGTDLKARFRDVWGFPIDDQTWAGMYPVIERMIKARYPASNAGADRVVSLGAGTLLDDAFVFNREQDDLTLQWVILQKPPGSTAAFDLPTMLNPIFSADAPGKYVLSLQASNQWVQGDPDLVTITVVDPGIIFSDGFEMR